MFRLRGLLVGATAVLLSAAAPSPAMRSGIAGLPQLMLWAWERPEDLRFVGRDAGIAFLAQTITIEPARLRIDRRRQRLRVADEAALIAVSRVEFPVTRALDQRDIDRIASTIAATSSLPRVKAIQIDFDATQSQRRMYRELISLVRARLDRAVPLSITALASWCAGDRWLDGLPIDEAVPMLFELGPLNEPYRELAASKTASHPACRGAVGIALNEPQPLRPQGRRVYVFNHQSWSAAAVAAAKHEALGHGEMR